MVKLNLNIEQHYLSILEQGFGELRGLVCLQYPIYCIHAKILDSTVEELDKVDKAILTLIDSSSLDSYSIASMLGISKRLIDERIRGMRNENFIQGEGDLLVTKAGFDFIAEGAEKRFKKSEIDFYIDGISLKPMVKEFSWHHSTDLISEEDYSVRTAQNGETYVHRPFAPDLVHEPIRPVKLENEIYQLNESERIKYGIPHGLEKIESFSFTMLTFPVLISLSDSGSANKFVTNGLSHSGDNQFIEQIQVQLVERIGGLIIQLNLDKDIAKVKNNWLEIDRSDFGFDRIFSFSKEDFAKYLKKEYGFSSLNPDQIECNKLELKIDVTWDMLDFSVDTRKVIENIIRGRDYLKSSPLTQGVWIFFISFKTSDKLVQEMCEVYEIYRSSEPTSVVDDILDFEKYMMSSLRKVLVSLELQHIQEQIDVDKFMFDPVDSI